MTRFSFCLLAGVLVLWNLGGAAQVQVYNSGILWEEPKVVDPGPVGGPPADAVILFDGKDLSEWNNGDKWKIENGVAIAYKTSISTKKQFGDCQLHIEWASPNPPKGRGQARGNNGVKMMGRYEIQILDSFENKTYLDGMCGALYKQRPPLVNVCRKPGEWQSFDIIFEAPRFDDAKKLVRPAYLTVLHNGVLIHNHVEIEGTTAYDVPPRYTAHGPKGPILLAYHGDPVRFRNIWVREFRELHSKKPGK